MKRKLSLSLGQSLLAVLILMVISAALVAAAQIRFDLVDRLEARIKKNYLPQPIVIQTLSAPKPTATAQLSSPTPDATLPSPTPVTLFLPSALDEPGMVLNILAVQNPLPTEDDLALDPTDNQAFLQSVLDTIFPESTSGLTEEQIVIEIQRYVSTSLLLKSNSGNATKILTEGYAICGGISISFRTLVRMTGIPARYIGTFGVVSQGGHALAEVYYDGQWHLFDPTYGLFFYSNPAYDQRGHIASFAEILSSATDGWYLFKTIDQPWVGRYDPHIRSFGVIRAEDDYLADAYGYPFMEAYRQMFATTFPVAYVNQQILSFPVEADFIASNSLSIGGLDSNTIDVVVTTTVAETSGRTGSSYLGGSPLEEIHTWFITAPSAGFVRIRYYSTEPDPPSLMLFPLKGIHVVDAVQEGNQAEFLLRITDPEASVQFWASDGVYWVDAMQAEWLGELDPSEVP